MSDANPYSAPEAVLQTEHEVVYQPKVFSFNGRIGRLRYLAYGVGVGMLLMLLGGVLMGVTAGATQASGVEGFSIAGVLLLALLVIASIVISIMFGKRRFNDLNRSGWWSLLLLIPYVQLLPMIYLVFFPGSDGSNNYGPAPKPNSLGVLILGWMMPVLFIVGILAAIAIPAYQDYLVRPQ